MTLFTHFFFLPPPPPSTCKWAFPLPSLSLFFSFVVGKCMWEPWAELAKQIIARSYKILKTKIWPSMLKNSGLCESFFPFYKPISSVVIADQWKWLANWKFVQTNGHLRWTLSVHQPLFWAALSIMKYFGRWRGCVSDTVIIHVSDLYCSYQLSVLKSWCTCQSPRRLLAELMVVHNVLAVLEKGEQVL